MKRLFGLFFFFLMLPIYSADYWFSGTAQERHSEMVDYFCETTVQPPIWERTYLTGDWGGGRRAMAEKGVTLSSTYVADTLGNPIGGQAKGIAFAGSFGVDMNINSGKFSNLHWLEFYSSVVARTGTNLSDKKIGNQFNVAQVYGGQNVRFNEMYFRLNFFCDELLIKLGRLNGGNDFLQSDLYYKYVNNGFDGNPVSIFLNSPSFVAYPNAAWGFFLRSVFFERLSTKWAIYVAEPEVVENKYHGFNWTFNGSQGWLLMTEWAYEINQLKGDTGLPGNYRAGFYFVTDQTGTKFLGGEFKQDYGYYFLLDQMIYRKGDASSDLGLTPFIALLFAPKDRNILPFFTTAGFVYKGLIPSRPEDYTNLGFIYGHYSSDLRSSQEMAKRTRMLGAFGNRPQHYEIILELNHWFQVNKWFQVVPDIQYVINPKGYGDIPNAIVVGAQIGAVF